MRGSHLHTGWLFFVILVFLVQFLLPSPAIGTDFSTVTKIFTSDEAGLVDAHVYEYSYRNWNNANWGGAPRTNISAHVDNIEETRARVYLMFDLDMFGGDADAVQKVELVLSVDASQIGSTTAEVHRVTQPWKEGNGTYHSGEVEQTAQAGAISWENQPEFDGQIWSTVELSEADGPYSVSFDITDLVKAWMKGTYPNHGIVIIGDENGSGGISLPFIGNSGAETYRFYFGSSENPDEGLKPKIVATLKENITPSVMSLPQSPELFMYTGTAEPVKSTAAAAARPVAFGSAANGGDILDLKIGMYPFEGPADIYFGIAMALYPSNIYLLTPDNRFQPLSSGVVPWKSGTTDPVDEVLLSGDTSGFPRGSYIFYLMVTPEGSFDTYYLWVTSLALLDASVNVVPGAITELGDGGASAVLSPDFLSEAGTVSMRVASPSSPDVISDEIALELNQASIGSGTFTMKIPVSQLPDNDASVVVEKFENGSWTPSGMILRIDRDEKTVTFVDSIRKQPVVRKRSPAPSVAESRAADTAPAAVYRVRGKYFGLSDWKIASRAGSLFEIEYTLTDSGDKVMSDAEWTNGSGKASDQFVPDYVEDVDLALNKAYQAHMNIRDSGGRQLFKPLTPPIPAIIKDTGDAEGNSPLGGPLNISNRENKDWNDIKTTAAHELIHVLQDQYYVSGFGLGQGINLLINKWFIEATADYFAALAVYPNSEDSRGTFYAGKLGGYLSRPLTSSDDTSYYAVAHFLDWCTKTYGGNIAADAMRGSNSQDVLNLNDALKAKGSSLGQAFDRYGKYLLTHPEDYGGTKDGFNVRALSDLKVKSQFTLSGLPRLTDQQTYVRFERDVQPLAMAFLNLPAWNSDKALLVADFSDSQLSDYLDLAAYLYGFSWKTGSNTDYTGKETLNPIELLRKNGDRIWTVEDVAKGEAHDGFHFLLANGWWMTSAAQKVRASIYLLLPPGNVSVNQNTVYWQHDPGNIPDGYIAGYNIYQNGKKLNGDTPVDPLLRGYSPVADAPVTVTVVDKYGNEWPRPPEANPQTASMVVDPVVPTIKEQVTAECRTAESQPTGTTWRFDWGDGTVETVLTPVDTHSYAQFGEFNASCTVVPATGPEITSDPVKVVVKAKPEVSISVTPQMGKAPLAVTATCLAVDPDGTIADYRVNFEETSVSTADGVATHTFNNNGFYSISCTAVDNDGLEGTSASMWVNVDTGEPGAFLRSICSVPSSPDVKYDTWGNSEVYYRDGGAYGMVKLAEMIPNIDTGLPEYVMCYEDDNQSGLLVARYEWWDNGNIQLEQHLIGEMYYDGVQKWWHENGVLKYESYYVQNKLQGISKDWNEQGIMTGLASYVDDALNGLSMQWCDNGMLEFKGNYINDLRNGLWSFWNCDGMLDLEQSFWGGKSHGYYASYYDVTGYKKEEGNYQYHADEDRSYREGYWKFYYNKDGMLKKEGELKYYGGTDLDFRESVPVGRWVYYYENGKKSEEGEYKYYKDLKKSVEEGDWRGWHENGTLGYKGSYVKGEKDGDWAYYETDGTLKETEKYSNGRLTEHCERVNGTMECTTY